MHKTLNRNTLPPMSQDVLSNDGTQWNKAIYLES